MSSDKIGFRQREGLTPPAQPYKKNWGDSPSESEVTAPASNTDVTTNNQPTGVPNGQAAAEPTTPTNDAPTGAGFEAPDEEQIPVAKDPTKADDYKQKIDVKVGDGVSASAAEQLGKQVLGGSLPYTPKAKTEEEIADTHERLMTDDPLYGIEYHIKQAKQMADERKPETNEERAAREKKERRQKIWSAVGDGLMALSNLYFTTQGAPNMYNKANSQQDALQKRFDKEKANREAREKEYNDLQIRLGDLYVNRGKTVREMEAAAEARKQAREKVEREQEKHNWEKLAQPAAQAAAEAKARTAAAEADWAEKYYGNRANNVGKSKSGGNYVEVEIVDPATGELKKLRVTGNEAAKILGRQNIDDSNITMREEDDIVLGTKKSTTTKGKSAQQKNAEETYKKRKEAAEKAKGKGGGNAGGGSSTTIPGKSKKDNTMPGVK